MDLSKRVVYDAEFPIVIVPPSGDDKGVVFYVKSLQSRSIQKIERVGRNELMAQKLNRGATAVSGDMLDAAETIERSKLIASITRWEWNGNSFGDIGKDPEFTPENLAAIVDHDNTQWIVDLLYAGAANIGNFTQK
jgi:hypothetical protein